MPIDFDLGSIQSTQFGLIWADENEPINSLSVDASVQTVLQQMVMDTIERMESCVEEPSIYNPGDTHAANEYLTASINDELCTNLLRIHSATNIIHNNSAIDNVAEAYAYFAKFTDAHGCILTAIRRATQFKGLLTSRLISFFSDSLQIVQDNMFKLDHDFDLLIDGHNVHIYRPSSFEFIGRLNSAITAAVSRNVTEIGQHLGFVNFSNIEQYALTHPRAARYIASIRSSNEMVNINQNNLRTLCRRTGVIIRRENGQLQVDDENVLAFLEVLDRRRYDIQLVQGQNEIFRAPSRKRVNITN